MLCVPVGQQAKTRRQPHRDKKSPEAVSPEAVGWLALGDRLFPKEPYRPFEGQPIGPALARGSGLGLGVGNRVIPAGEAAALDDKLVVFPKFLDHFRIPLPP